MVQKTDNQTQIDGLRWIMDVIAEYCNFMADIKTYESKCTGYPMSVFNLEGFELCKAVNCVSTSSKPIV